MTVNQITTEADAVAFVERLRSPRRDKPFVLVSTRMGETSPLIDVKALVAAVGAHADISVVRSGPATFKLAELITNEANAYGGASRVYPLGTAWEKNVYLSPLRFVWNPADADRALRNLIRDVRDMSAPAPTTSAKPLANSLSELAPLRELFAVMSNSPATPPSPASPPSAPAHERAAAPAGPAAVAAACASPASAPAAEPTPAPEPEQPAKGKSALQSAQLSLAAARAEIARLNAERQETRRSVDALVEERVREMKIELARAHADARDRADRHAEQLAAARRKPKTVETAETCVGFCPDLFPTAEDAVRHGIYMAWVSRIPASAKAERPLPDYVVGDEFADTLALFDAGQQAKAFRACVDVLTGMAKDVTGRRLHALRAGDGGDDPQRTRTADGAVGFRVNVETNTASARRLHFWKRTDGTIELARVVLHDDMSI